MLKVDITATHCKQASSYGHKAAVQVLLEKGANANFNNGKYSNALKRRLIQHMKDADAFGKERRP